MTMWEVVGYMLKAEAALLAGSLQVIRASESRVVRQAS